MMCLHIMFLQEKAAKLSEKLERARKAFEATNSSTIMLEVDRRTGTAKPAGFKTRHDRAKDAEHEMLNKFISAGDRTEQEIKKREDRRARKRGPETEQDKMNKLRQSMFTFCKITSSSIFIPIYNIICKANVYIYHDSDRFTN